MSPMLVKQPLSVTLTAGEWLWLLGLLTAVHGEHENSTLDKLYAQVMEAVD